MDVDAADIHTGAVLPRSNRCYGQTHSEEKKQELMKNN